MTARNDAFAPAAPGGVVLRPWREADLAPFAEMNADPEVMRHFPATLSLEESRALLERLRDGIEARGWGVWAVEVDGQLAGMTGLMVPRFEAPFMPCTEILWRFRRAFWGRGCARAAAAQALARDVPALRLKEVVAFTAASNLRSIRLMERLEFKRDPQGDFQHPGLPEGHPLRPHVLYRWRTGGAAP